MLLHPFMAVQKLGILETTTHTFQLHLTSSHATTIKTTTRHWKWVGREGGGGGGGGVMWTITPPLSGISKENVLSYAQKRTKNLKVLGIRKT